MKPRVVARLLRAYAPSWLHRPKTPVRLVLAVTRRCNLRCTYCKTWTLPATNELTEQEVAKLMKDLPSLVWLDLTGGEPFMRPDIKSLFDAVLECAPNLAVLHFPTSGWFPERAVDCARLVRQKRPDVELIVTVSVDGPPDLHDKLRGRRGAYERARETWQGLRSVSDVEVRLGTTIGPHNVNAISTMLDCLYGDFPGFEDRLWHVNLAQTSAHFYANEGIEPLRASEALAVLRRAMRALAPPRSLVDVGEIAYLLTALGHLSGRSMELRCHALHSGAFISADAVLYPCHKWNRPVADIRAFGFRMQDIWHSENVVRARSEVLAGLCGGCVTPCELYPTIASQPLRAMKSTIKALLAFIRSR